MDFRPLGNRVIVKVEEVTATKTGILLPGSGEKPLEGIVEAIGTKLKEKIEVGDLIAYGKYSGTEIEIDSVKYLIMSVDDIFGVKG